MRKMRCFRRLVELKKRVFERIKEKLEQTNLMKQMIPEMPQTVAAIVQIDGFGDDVLYGSRIVVMNTKNGVTLLSVDDNGAVVQVRRYDNAMVVEDTRPVTLH